MINRRVILVFILFMLSASVVQAADNEYFSIFGVSLRESRQSVTAKFKKKKIHSIYKEDTSYIVYPQTLTKSECTDFALHFYEDMVSVITCTIKMNNQYLYVDRYYDILAIMIDKYGEPSDESEIPQWLLDSGVNIDNSYLSTFLMQGQVKLINIWYFSDVRIVLNLSPHDSEDYTNSVEPILIGYADPDLYNKQKDIYHGNDF